MQCSRSGADEEIEYVGAGDQDEDIDSLCARYGNLVDRSHSIAAGQDLGASNHQAVRA